MSTNFSSLNIGYESPNSANEARNLLEKHGKRAKIVAGGQTLSLLVQHKTVDPDVLIDISSIPEFGRIKEGESFISIGATVTYDQLLSNPVVTKYSALYDAVSGIADRSVRNMGTVGGAISHSDPAFDIVPALLGMDATVHIASVDGKRTVPLSEFQCGHMTTDLGDNELVETITFDKRDSRSNSAYICHAHNGYWSTVGVCAAITLSTDSTKIKEAKVALAGVDEYAVRSPSVEKRLKNKPLSKTMIQNAAEAVIVDFDPIDRISEPHRQAPPVSDDYKCNLSEVLTQRSIQQGVKRAGGEL